MVRAILLQICLFTATAAAVPVVRNPTEPAGQPRDPLRRSLARRRRRGRRVPLRGRRRRGLRSRRQVQVGEEKIGPDDLDAEILEVIVSSPRTSLRTRCGRGRSSRPSSFLRPFPDRHLADRVLILALGLTDDERHVAGLADRRKAGASPLRSASSVVTILAVDLSPPSHLSRGVNSSSQVYGERITSSPPGWSGRRCWSRKRRRVVQPVDQVGRQHQVVAGELRLQVVGIALPELDPARDDRPDRARAATSRGTRRARPRRDRVADVALLLQLVADADEARGEVDARDLGAEARPARSWRVRWRSPDRGPGERRGRLSVRGRCRPARREVRHAEILLAIVEFAVLGDQRVGLVHRPRGSSPPACGLDVAEAGVLEEMAPEGVARVAGGLVAGRDPRAALDQVVPGVEGRRREIVVPAGAPRSRESR